jgi:hypothetical protein
MIEKLNKRDLEEAAKIYIKGLSMEKPKGYATLKETISDLKKLNCFIHKTENKIDGLITFNIENKEIIICFICAIKIRKGIGKKLMKRLAVYSLKNKIETIKCIVSSRDKRALGFYQSLGFKKYDKYFKRKNFLLYKIQINPKNIL